MIVFAAIVAVMLVLLYARWKARYRFPPADVPRILCYHKFSDRFCFEGTWLPRRRFVEQVDFLLGRGYRFIGEEEYYESLQRRTSENAKKILLTFDDGYEELFDVYVEDLVPRGIPILVFLVADFAGRENTWDLSLGRRPFVHLSWDQVREMADLGARFGSHGLSHADVTRLTTEGLCGEINDSRRFIGEQTGREILSFSYPFGRYDRRSKAAVEAAGYTGAFSLYPSHTNEYVDWFCLRRNGVYIIDTTVSLGWKLEGSCFFWFEEMKCRTINALSVLTPLLKNLSRLARLRDR
jgi:peptidoglycan/xylan/chitin deacetylase (PgdA/CDA1 family)